MTYNELKAHVAGLGFEEIIEDESALALAAERALSILFLDRPQLATARIYVCAPRLNKAYEKIKHVGGAVDEIVLTGFAFSFLPHSDGECTLIDGARVELIPFTATGDYVKGSIGSGSATLVFDGEEDCTVTRLAVFGSRYDTTPDRIPEYTEKRVVELSALIADFRTLAAPPRYPDGRTASEVELLGGAIRVPFLLDSELVLDYYRTPKRIDRGDVLIDLPAGTEQLFPLLVASFLWLDDDAQKAQYYMALYRDAIVGLGHGTRLEGTKKYITNGWA